MTGQYCLANVRYVEHKKQFLQPSEIIIMLEIYLLKL